MTTAPAPTTAPDLHPLEYESGYWTCPITGACVPKTDQSHVRWRQQLLNDTRRHTANQNHILDLCSQSLPLFVNAFGWTYKFKDVRRDGKEIAPAAKHVPFNTFPCQDDALLELQRCVAIESTDTGSDALIDKSRDMGASWLLIELVAWLWLFHADSRCVLASRVEDEIDKRGSPRSLFWKLDYQLQRVPTWMLPVDDPKELHRGGENRQYMQLTNPKNGATVSGTATTAHIAVGDRATMVAMDEMSRMATAEEAWEAAADVTFCRIANSTPIGAGTKYSQLYFQGLRTGTPKVIGLYYYDHPEKGQGREWRVDEHGELTREAGAGYWWTPWLEQERSRRTPIYMAQNIFAKHTTAGNSFFTTSAVTRHIQQYAKEPLRCEFDTERARPGFVETPSSGRWYVWCNLDRDGRPVQQDTNYVIFADPSYGTGEANAAIAVLDTNSGEFVAEYVDPYTPPQTLTHLMMDAGWQLFFGQAGQAFLGWEVNGPGEAMHFDFRERSYPLLYFNRHVENKTNNRSKTYGWRSTETRKRILCSQIDKAVTKSEVIVRSQPALWEMTDYVFFENGSIGPSKLADEQTGARQAHGDRVIAHAGAVMLKSEAPKFQPAGGGYPAGSLGEMTTKMMDRRRKAQLAQW